MPVGKFHTLARSSCQTLLFAPPPPRAAITVFHCNCAAGCSHPLAAAARCCTHAAPLHAVARTPHPLPTASHMLAACHPFQLCPHPLPPAAPPTHAACCRTHTTTAAYCYTHAPFFLLFFLRRFFLGWGGGAMAATFSHCAPQRPP
jgi:hypothetical protein